MYKLTLIEVRGKKLMWVIKDVMTPDRRICVMLFQLLN